ncbi:MAG: ABC transporter permease [Chthonomonadales bacterium]
MRGTFVVFRREMRSYFVSPAAYAVLAALLALAGWYFYQLTVEFVLFAQSATEQAMMFQQAPPILNVNLLVVRPWFNIVSQLLLFVAPIITMKLLAEERGTGRLDLLMSAPITEMQLILGKLLAGTALLVLFLVPTVFYQAALFAYGNPELGQILTGYAGLVLHTAALICLGLAISSLTSSQVVAAVAGFGVSIAFWVIGPRTTADTSFWNSLLSNVSLLRHFVNFSSGVIEMRDLVFYATFLIFVVFITHRSVESQRWRG